MPRIVSWKQSLQCQVDNFQYMTDHIDESEVGAAIDMLLQCRGLLLFAGVGQNLLVASKAASTYNSLALRAVSIDPVAALHGGMGLMRREDLVILISKSGETSELLQFMQACRQLGHSSMLGIHSSRGSSLASGCRRAVYLPMVSEADHLDLAPTASSVCILGFLQALAAHLANEAGLSESDYRRTHPGGTIGLGPAEVR